ncbi:hypothetical protein K8I28_10020 [bacterium]|nr:hypothetical protein [bacterium]
MMEWLPKRFLFQIFLYSILILHQPVNTFALDPPWFRISLNSGYLTNLYFDSTEANDSYASLFATVEQPLGSFAYLYYEGTASQYLDNTAYSSMSHSAGLEMNYSLAKTFYGWVTGSTSLLGYHNEYTIYNRFNQRADAGIRWEPGDVTIFRLGSDFINSTYPDASDTLQIDYREFSNYIGINTTLILPFVLHESIGPLPFSFDSELGFQNRLYLGDESPQTGFAYLSFRLSAPLSPRTGSSLKLILKQQADENQVSLRSLYVGGIDPGVLLWSGWRGIASVSRLLGNWRADVYLGYRQSKYVETVTATFISLPQRYDTNSSISFGLQRNFRTKSLPLLTGFQGVYRYEINDSNDAFYTYDLHSIRLIFFVEML